MISKKINNICFSIDFQKDMAKNIESILKGAGASFSATNQQKIIEAFFNFLHRRIRPCKRKLILSKEMSSIRILPSGLFDLKRKSENGSDINCFLSKKIKDLNYNDSLFNDWKIQHFHLGSGKDKDGFIKRSGPVLMALVDNESIYCIGVYKHGNWENTELIIKAIANWPMLFETYLLKEAKSARPNIFTSENVRNVRKKGAVMCVEANGKLYLPPGGGYMCSGLSIDVRIKTDHLIRSLNELEKKVEKSIEANIHLIENHFFDTENISVLLANSYDFIFHTTTYKGFDIKSENDKNLYVHVQI